MALYKTAQGWRYEFQRHGKRISGSGFKTKKMAMAAMAERRKDVAGQGLTEIGTTFSAIANTYLDFSARTFVKNTHRQKINVCRSFIKYSGDMPIQHITAHHLFKYLNTRPTNNNYNAHRRDLCAVFSYAMDVLEVIRKNPCRNLKKMPHNPDPKYIPPEIDILRLLAVTDPKTDERDLILTLIYSMARIDEVLRLKWEDVNLEKRVLKKWTRKRTGGSYEAVEISMTDELHLIMKRRWHDRKNQTWVFYNEKTKNRFTRRPKLMNALCKRADIDPPFGFHALRHFVASLMADSGKVSKKTIGALLGHKELKTTEIYLHSIESSEKEAMSILSGKFGT